jgi:hypothetical protein
MDDPMNALSGLVTGSLSAPISAFQISSKTKQRVMDANRRLRIIAPLRTVSVSAMGNIIGDRLKYVLGKDLKNIGQHIPECVAGELLRVTVSEISCSIACERATLGAVSAMSMWGEKANPIQFSQDPSLNQESLTVR